VEQYSTTASFTGRADPVLSAAVTTLTNNGFAIVDRMNGRTTLAGPGLTSTRQNPILGASRIEIAVRGQTLHVDAELGGIVTMRRFLRWFPLLLGLGLGLLFAVLGAVVWEGKFDVGLGLPWPPGLQWFVATMALGILPVVPWLFISPLLIRMVRRRTERALDVLANNAAFAGR
jgi:hypothetical protein